MKGNHCQATEINQGPRKGKRKGGGAWRDHEKGKVPRIMEETLGCTKTVSWGGKEGGKGRKTTKEVAKGRTVAGKKGCKEGEPTRGRGGRNHT